MKLKFYERLPFRVIIEGLGAKRTVAFFLRFFKSSKLTDSCMQLLFIYKQVLKQDIYFLHTSLFKNLEAQTNEKNLKMCFSS